ncbi:18023_t:CDS:2 [Acaulospora morrowiae]|uniref:18023_t:CDS:1 n=1 Tax=Acaulospora morrowiae TaxID=94023 RepID=A0A9N8V412_9GLOM|nr:18023_t:CDS:2 [Acaulospora morrowiae]
MVPDNVSEPNSNLTIEINEDDKFIKNLFNYFLDQFNIQHQSSDVATLVKIYIRKSKRNFTELFHQIIRSSYYPYITSLVGFFYRFGIGTLIDYKMAFEMFSMAANENTDIRQKFRDNNSSPVNMHTASNKILGFAVDKDMENRKKVNLLRKGIKTILYKLVRDVDVPSPPTPTLKKLQFSSTILMHDTWTREDYDRRGDHSTCNKLTPLLAQRIKRELNEYKMAEMEVHEDSKKNTHFFA